LPRLRSLRRLGLLVAAIAIVGFAGPAADAQTADGAGDVNAVGREDVLLQNATTDALSADQAVTYRTIYLDGVRVAWHTGVYQVITVNRTSGSHARISFWQYSTVKKQWVRIYRTIYARIGYGGLVSPQYRVQGKGQTPVGTYSFPFTFGLYNRSPYWKMPYHQLRSGDWWVEDNASVYYNRLRQKSQGGFRWWLPASDVNSSEDMYRIAKTGQYRYGLVTSFNYYHPVKYRGAGIFLHVNGKGATAGCVSAPEWFIKDALLKLNPTWQPLIAIGW